MNEAAIGLADAASLSPWALFLQADIVVKAVMVGLLLASIWSWAIIVDRARKLKSINREAARFEDHFWQSESIDNLYEKSGKSKHPSAQVFNAGMGEWKRSISKGRLDREGVRARLTSIMNVAIAREIDELSDRLNILATVGSVAPFVGLFGTVWGIMRAFTAIGLFAAIPAVIGYNRLLHGIGRIEARLSHFADEFHGLLSRQLDGMEEK